MIAVKFNDRQVLDTLNRLSTRVKNLRPAFSEIGEDMVEITKRRFDTATGPDGKAWAANSPVTIDRYLGSFAKSFKKDGTLSKKGAARATNKKPLTGKTGTLKSTISYQASAKGVVWGSPKVYAAIQQFGGAKSEFPNLWGDIPARPYLGVSAADNTLILDILKEYFAK